MVQKMRDPSIILHEEAPQWLPCAWPIPMCVSNDISLRAFQCSAFLVLLSAAPTAVLRHEGSDHGTPAARNINKKGLVDNPYEWSVQKEPPALSSTLRELELLEATSAVDAHAKWRMAESPVQQGANLVRSGRDTKTHPPSSKIV